MATIDRRSLVVYVVTSTGLVPGRDHRDVALAAIEGGATAIQLRAPELPDDELAPLATELATACRDAGVLFVVNDRVEVAARVGAGAHVGQEDDPAAARRRLGPGAALGISVTTVEEGLAAAGAGADYLGVTVWATPTKPEAVPQGIHAIRALADGTGLPVVAIGGIHAGNAREVLEAGASGVAVVSAVGAARDPVAATRELVAAAAGQAGGRGSRGR
jgi:thiamine-phosphate diphosphorylase